MPRDRILLAFLLALLPIFIISIAGLRISATAVSWESCWHVYLPRGPCSVPSGVLLGRPRRTLQLS